MWDLTHEALLNGSPGEVCHAMWDWSFGISPNLTLPYLSGTAREIRLPITLRKLVIRGEWGNGGMGDIHETQNVGVVVSLTAAFTTGNDVIGRGPTSLQPILRSFHLKVSHGNGKGSGVYMLPSNFQRCNR